MKNKGLVIIVLIAGVFFLGFIRVWPHTSIFGSARINSYEFFAGCWQGDVRTCDYDPFQ